MKTLIRKSNRVKRHCRIRAKVAGTAQRPRLSVHKSLKHLRVQLIDDASGRTLVSLSTLGIKTRGTVEQAKALGLALAERALSLGIKQVVFDRGGYPYHGQVQAVAEAAREAGLIF